MFNSPALFSCQEYGTPHLTKENILSILQGLANDIPEQAREDCLSLLLAMEDDFPPLTQEELSTLLTELEGKDSNNSPLTSLDLSKKKLTNNDIQKLLQAVEKNTSLIYLNLSNNKIETEAVAQLAKNISLTSLVLSSCDIRDEGIRELTPLFEKKTFTSLNLSSNNISQKGIQILGLLLAKNTSLTSLVLTNCNIGDKGAIVLALLLAKNTTLTSLVLSSCNIGDKGAIALALLLAKNTTLTSLVLSDNNIGNIGARALARNTSLTSLDLSINSIKEGAKAFLKNNSLLFLNMNGTQIGDFLNQEIRERIIINNIIHTCKNFIRIIHILAKDIFDPHSQSTWKCFPREISFSILSSLAETINLEKAPQQVAQKISSIYTFYQSQQPSTENKQKESQNEIVKLY